MKKLLLLVFLISFSTIVVGQTGVGWGQQRSKVHFKDSTYFSKGLIGTGDIGSTTSRFTKGWFTNIEITNLPTINGGTLKIGLGFTTVGNSFVTLANPGAITFPQINADNSVTAQTAADYKISLSLNNVINESKATMFTSAAFTGNVPTAGGVNLGRISSITSTLTAGAVTDVTLTGVTTKPYGIMIQTTAGKDITNAVSDSLGISVGIYHLYVYSVDLITNAEIKVVH